MGNFDSAVAKFAKSAKSNLDRQVREITLTLFSSVIDMSPVGNPELWAANAHNVTLRNTYTAYADALNAQGDGKRISTSRATLDRKFGKLSKPKGYVGGRFRANWNTSVGAPDETTTDAVDPTGNKAKAGVMANMGGAGTVTYLCNALPYGERLEFEGWSKQAPAGMVRISMANVDGMVRDA